jgi:dolichyl-phosphate-mannose-protein mannosyltransferase
LNRADANRAWAVPLAVAGLTALAFAIRLSGFDQGLYGDELSTAWIVKGQSLGHVLSEVHSDAEITPPLYFVLAWLTSKLGASPDWLRLGSLIAGTATIPLVYAIGARTVGRAGGVVAAAVVTLSPVLVYYSTEARAYAVMAAFVAASTLSMLLALDTGKRRWWVAYGAFTCLAMYSHYTAAFPLIAQLAWLLWAEPASWVAALAANGGAAIAYIPWIPGFLADRTSATIPIVNLLLPFNLGTARGAIGQWALGRPYASIHSIPGVWFVGLMIAGGLLAVGAAAYRLFGRARGTGLRAAVARIPRRTVLIVLLALATPVGEAIYSAVGTNLLGSRNLNASWPGLAVAIGGAIAAAGPVLGVVAGVLVIGGYGIGAAKSLQAKWARPDFPAAAAYIEHRAGPRDVVVDAAIFPFVVPLTALDAYLPQTRREYRLDLPSGPPPFTGATPRPPAPRLIGRAIRDGRDARIFVVAGVGNVPGGLRGLTSFLENRSPSEAGVLLRRLPRGYRVVAAGSFPGLEPLAVIVIDGPGVRGPPRPS